jgi:aspartate oxidase
VRAQAAKADPATEDLDVPDLVRSLRAQMWRQVGIERDAEGLARAERTFAFWLGHQARGEFRERAGWELQNQLVVAALVAQAASRRHASVGTHTRSDSRGAVEQARFAVRRAP